MADHEYRFWTEWSHEDGEWVGLCDGFPLVSWLEPERDKAEAGIRAVVAEIVGNLREEGEPVPRPGVQWPPQTAAGPSQAQSARSRPGRPREQGSTLAVPVDEGCDSGAPWVTPGPLRASTTRRRRCR